MGVDLGGGIEFYAGPPVLGAPDDLDAVIRGFIDGATSRLLIAVQELDSRLIAENILAARARRVRTQIILEGDYLREEKPVADPWAATGENEGNRVIHAALLRAGIDLITDLNPDIFHQKFIVRDPGKPTAAVLTGSANFTHTDTGTNPPDMLDKPGNNLNHVVVLHGRQATDLYLAEFERLRSGTFGALHERVEPRPSEFRLGGLRVKPVFAPDQGPEMEIMKQMLKATERVDFAMFTFAQSSGIDDTMGWMLKAGIPVRGVLDRGQGSQKWAATVPLKKAGAQLYENTPGNGVRKVHHKLMVIDRRLTIVGSFNYTAPAATLNDENIVVLGDLEETDPAAIAAQERLAGYALAEIDRIITELARPA
ncbi:phospholipase D/transphosphatidylase [Actinoplanes sp. SE50]|uniref:phospholipase D-like domain-containing protein n=1 Tax=unclassified Actinoplanes TaxID=2626549 RepID=UPI00023EC23E|nr:MULTISPECIES: phospholipase D-like domain-containing protein [unclassified Actinoplanes]AEV83013.1 phospholipase D/transphosphatidylase [Actinoplanes sp. SE50/110]ATO81409.1 phospholipase D/transphosphatidylase [Actinoplanes sp. SE50]SLL98816.1 phospholipase D/transphosphatidylase [Actinoplanes sp. SE50/110]